MNVKIMAAGLAAIVVIASVAVIVIMDEGWPGHGGLEIFGNADGDWSVDADDIAYIQAIIDGEEEPNKFADANRDGKIDEKDIAHVQALIDGEADFIWILDGNGAPVKVSLPVERIGVEYLANAELMNVLGVSDKVVALDEAAYLMKDFYFPGKDFSDGQMKQMYSSPDFENIIVKEMNLDILFTFSSDTATKAEKLPGTDVVFLGLYWPNVLEPQDSRFMQGVIKAGYILDAVDRANDYKAWLEGLVETLDNRTSEIAWEDRPSVLMTAYNNYFDDENTDAVTVYTKIDPLSQACILAGGRPIAENFDNWIGEDKIYKTIVSVETILTQDPEYIFAHSVRYTYSGLTREPAHGYDHDDISNFTAAVEDMLDHESLKSIPAYEAPTNVYIIAGDFRNNAMGGILGAVYMANILHPDLFTDLDPVAVHQEFVSDWMNLDYNLSTNGVFIAPAV